MIIKTINTCYCFITSFQKVGGPWSVSLQESECCDIFSFYFIVLHLFTESITKMSGEHPKVLERVEQQDPRFLAIPTTSRQGTPSPEIVLKDLQTPRHLFDEVLREHSLGMMRRLDLGPARCLRNDNWKPTGMLLHAYADDLVFALPKEINF